MDPTRIFVRPFGESEQERSDRLLVHRASLKMPLPLLDWWEKNSDDYVPPKSPNDPHKHITDSFREVPRLVYRLIDVEGLNEKEVAAITARPAAKVRRALNRAREMLKARLA